MLRALATLGSVRYYDRAGLELAEAGLVEQVGRRLVISRRGRDVAHSLDYRRATAAPTRQPPVAVRRTGDA
jgi:hypothetical protein